MASFVIIVVNSVITINNGDFKITITNIQGDNKINSFKIFLELPRCSGKCDGL